MRTRPHVPYRIQPRCFPRDAAVPFPVQRLAPAAARVTRREKAEPISRRTSVQRQPTQSRLQVTQNPRISPNGLKLLVAASVDRLHAEDAHQCRRKRLQDRGQKATRFASEKFCGIRGLRESRAAPVLPPSHFDSRRLTGRSRKIKFEPSSGLTVREVSLSESGLR
jgi:hypothetical protein